MNIRFAPGGAAPEGLDTALLKARLKERLLGVGSGVPLRLGRFELLQRLGIGGEGTVFEGRDPHGGALVALKQLHPSTVDSAASLTREFRALADIVHPNLVALHELFCVDEQWFYSMERIHGTDIVHNMGRSGATAHSAGPLRLKFVQLLHGLSAIHAAGMIHRDLKPSNVLVGSDERVVILDYGTVINQPRESGAMSDLVGTPAFVAPEQARGEPLPASDLYAVGVILFQLLTGRLPFVGTAFEQLGCKQREDAPRVRTLAPDVASDLDALCAALLARDPAARPSLDDTLTWLAPGERSRRAPPKPAAQPCFVGREAHLAALAALAAPPKQGATVALIHGESGVGKSALLARFCSMLRADGAWVVEGRCHEREHTPYKVFGGMITQLVRRCDALAPGALSAAQYDGLARLFPELRSRDARSSGTARAGNERPSSRKPDVTPRERKIDAHEPDGEVSKVGRRDEPSDHGAGTSDAQSDVGEARAQAFSAARALLHTLAAVDTCVLAVDDLQWGDLDSIRLLEHVLAGPDAPPVLLVGVYRGSERASSPFLRAALDDTSLRGRQVRVVECQVDPLEPAVARSLLRTLSGDRATLTSAELDAKVAHARGLPFALTQLADPPDALGSDPADSIDALVQQRVALSSPRARQLLALLCVAGRPLETTLALRAASAGSEGWRSARELCSSKLARWLETESALCIEPYHDIIRVAVARRTETLESRALHTQIVSAMDALGMDDPEHLMQHALGAGEHARAGDEALRAATQAERALAWNRAVELLTLARSLRGRGEASASPHSAPHAEQLVIDERLARALAAADRHREAADSYLEAAAVWRAHPFERQRLQAAAAQQLMRADDTVRGIALATRLLAEIGLRLPRHPVTAGLHYLINRVRQRAQDCDPRRPKTTARSLRSRARMNVLAAVHNEMWMPDPIRGSVVHTWFYAEARRHADHRLVEGLFQEVMHVALKYGPRSRARCERLLARLDALTRAGARDREQALVQLARATYLLQCRVLPRSALPLLEEADDRLSRSCPGTSFERGWLALAREAALEYVGDYRALVDSVARRERLAHGDSYAARLLIASVPLARLVEDRPDAAISFLNGCYPSARAHPLIDLLALSRHALSLSYKGETQQGYDFFREHLHGHWLSGPLASHLISDTIRYEYARNAAALYFETGAPQLKREVQRYLVHAERQPVVWRALFGMIAATVACADGERERARAGLRGIIAELALTQADSYAWAARYRLAQLERAASDLSRAHAWFRERGVVAPERFVTLCLPGPPSW